MYYEPAEKQTIMRASEAPNIPFLTLSPASFKILNFMNQEKV